MKSLETSAAAAVLAIGLLVASSGPALATFDFADAEDACASGGVGLSDGDVVVIGPSYVQYKVAKGSGKVSGHNDSDYDKRDLIFGDGGGNDTLNGGMGDDILCGGGNGDVLNGGNGDDDLVGGGYGDVLHGGRGEDDLFGGGNGDELFGGNDDDVLVGGGDGDQLDAGRGEDDLTGGGGTGDDLRGGRGDDVCTVNATDEYTNCETVNDA